jgi:hypothetical protein
MFAECARQDWQLLPSFIVTSGMNTKKSGVDYSHLSWFSFVINLMPTAALFPNSSWNTVVARSTLATEN